MYISRVEIDDKNRRKIKNLTHLGAYHNWVENSFPAEVDAHERMRHLWRIDRLNGKRYLLIVSQNKPDLEKMTQYGVACTAMVKDYDHFIDKIANDQVMNFRLTANPTHRENGKVYPHITVEQQKEWLEKRSEHAGFQLLNNEAGSPAFDIVNRDWPTLYHQRRVRLSRVSFEGLLKVTDSELFKQTLVQGIGREKAFGMGMITVIPVQQDYD